MHLFKRLLIVPVLWASTSPGAEMPQPSSQTYLELDEVLVQGRRPVTDPEQMTAWLSRLVGEFRYEGYVERRSDAGTAVDRAEVQGGSRCTNIGAPGLVQCEMNVRWQELPGTGVAEIPGGVSWLTPAVAVYGMYDEGGYRPNRAADPQHIGHMQVDSRGLAETGLGQLYENTLIYKSPCADLPGNCQRVVQIEAPPGGRIILMRVDVQRDAKLKARYVFQWHRIAQSVAASDNPPPPAVTRAGGTIMPVAMQAWTGKLVGKFQGYIPRSGTTCLPTTILPSREQVAEMVRRCAVVSDMECRGIGSGPGVRCVRDMGWQETRVPSGSQAAYELWGYDPVAQRVVHASALPMWIRNAGGVEFATGTLGGLQKDALTWTSLCHQRSACKTIESQVIIPPDGRHIAWTTRNSRGETVGTRMIRIDADAPADLVPETPKVRSPSPRRP